MGIDSSSGGGMMAKMTKAQMKRMVGEIRAKTKKLFMQAHRTVSVQDMGAIDKLCTKWAKRIG